MRRLPTIAVLLGALALIAGLMPGVAGAAGPVPARPATSRAANPGELHIVKVSGLLDPVLADFVEKSIGDAERQHAVGVVLQLNSTGSVISDARFRHLAARLHDAKVPVSIWVGPSGAKAHGRAAQLLGVVGAVAVAPGSSVGRTGDLAFDKALLRPAFRDDLAALHDRTIGYLSAHKLGVATLDGPVLGDFILQLPGVQTKLITTAKGPRRQPTTTPVFSQLPIANQLFHTVASPSVAYLLFLIGMVLIMLELFTAGVGIAGLVGAGSFVLGCYGLAVLPANPLGIGLLVFSMLAFAIDIQTGVPRVWTGVGTGALVVGTFTMYDGMSVPLLTVGLGIVGTFVFMFAGLPSLVRSRFSTPTIGREWMVGHTGEAVADVSPEGIVRVDGGLWRARASGATPIRAGEPVRIAEVQGLLLQVEVPSGEAEDGPVAADEESPSTG